MNKNILITVELIKCVSSITAMQLKLDTNRDTVSISLLESFAWE